MTSPHTQYHLICGLEIHAELKTKSKMFCACKNDPFHAPKPNIYTCPTCLGMPGGLPVPNRQAIEWTIKLGLALHCQVNLFSKFDRKHYFYPDLPKGYQISQYDLPFCHDGYLDTALGRVRIRRIHLEEDTGKLLHETIDGEKVTLVDLNRSGVPLLELVTEPDIHSPAQAKEFGKQFRELVRYVNISDADMQKGGMRLEANISLSTADPTDSSAELPNYKVEVKNINSFKFTEQAIEYEMERQAAILDQGETPVQETRGWNAVKNITISQRSKEEAEDYRYFPDPDIPPLHFTLAQIEEWRTQLPELPEAKLKRWQSEYGVEERFGQALVAHQVEATWFEHLFQAAQNASIAPNELAKAISNKQLTYQISDEPVTILESYQASIATESIDTDELNTAISRVLAENPDAVEKYQQGKTQVLGFILGQVSRQLQKKLDMSAVKTAVETALASL